MDGGAALSALPSEPPPSFRPAFRKRTLSSCRTPSTAQSQTRSSPGIGPRSWFTWTGMRISPMSPRPGSSCRPWLIASLRSAKLSALPSGAPAGPAPGCVRPRGRATGGCSRTQRRWRPSSRSSGLLQTGTRKQRGSVGRLTRTSVGSRPSVLEVRMLDRAAWPSGLGKGLQSPVPQFDSGRRLQ